MQAKPKLHQSLVNPRCAVDEKGFPVFELLYVSDPSADGEYLRGIIRAVNRQPIEADLLAALKAAGECLTKREGCDPQAALKIMDAAIARAEEL